MKFIRIGRADGGLQPDPGEYLNRLPDIKQELPVGARTFAMDVEHYDFFAMRCVHALGVDRITCHDAPYEQWGASEMSVTLALAPNPFRHDAGLVIRYRNVQEFAVDTTPESGRVVYWYSGNHRLGDVQLDEILPHEWGCSHEIELTGGVIRVVCADLQAEWRSGVGWAGGLGMDGEHLG